MCAVHSEAEITALSGVRTKTRSNRTKNRQKGAEKAFIGRFSEEDFRSVAPVLGTEVDGSWASDRFFRPAGPRNSVVTQRT
jgi:hypothetical protein